MRATILCLTFFASLSHAETIPLDQIWAYRMEGTRDVTKFEPEVYGPDVQDLPAREQQRRYAASHIRTLLATLVPLVYYMPESSPSRFKQVWGDAKQGFAVVGEGEEALRQAHAVLVEGNEPLYLLPAQQEISLVYFSIASSFLHQLHRVERQGNVIDVRYHSLAKGWGSGNFALIPLGRLEPGEYHVNVIRSPTPKDLKHLEVFTGRFNPKFERSFICRPFSFRVTSQGGKRRE